MSEAVLPEAVPGLGHVQGVVFVLRDALGRILMERCPKKAARHGAEWFIPGGRIEDVDRNDRPSAAVLALYREMAEELGCEPTAVFNLPIIDACGGPEWPHFLIQPFLVTAWRGEVPSYCLDHPEVPLRWVEPAEAIASPAAVVRALVAAAVPAREWGRE